MESSEPEGRLAFGGLLAQRDGEVSGPLGCCKRQGDHACGVFLTKRVQVTSI